ncbi:hypothetical protein FRC03_011542 [Tulasnella sp. 419]|nr:hypothetical protein FRC03_011542 [Tulasnella sp. 419]
MPGGYSLQLFNYLATNRLPEPKCAQVRDGPEHAVTWTASVTVDGYFRPQSDKMERRTFTGTAPTKRAANEAAAREALHALGVNLRTLQD